MKSKNVLIGLLTIGVIVTLVLFLNRGKELDSDAGVRPIKVAFNTWIGYSSFYIAEEKGMFSKRGIKVETKVIDPLADKNAALVRGDLDAMGGTIDSSVISAASGVDGKVVFMFDRSNGTDGILAANGISSIADLKGKSVAVEEGFVGHFFLLYMLEKNGLQPSDVKLVPMTTDAAGAAFVAGQVDAAVTWEPYLSTAMKREGAKVLVSSDKLEPILADTLFVSNRALRVRSDDIEKLVSALQEANSYWISNPDECTQIVSKRWSMPADDIKGIMSTVELYSLENQKKQFGTTERAGDLLGYIGKAADLWKKAGVIDKAINVEQLVDSSFVQKLGN